MIQRRPTWPFRVGGVVLVLLGLALGAAFLHGTRSWSRAPGQITLILGMALLSGAVLAIGIGLAARARRRHYLGWGAITAVITLSLGIGFLLGSKPKSDPLAFAVVRDGSVYRTDGQFRRFVPVTSRAGVDSNASSLVFDVNGGLWLSVPEEGDKDVSAYPVGCSVVSADDPSTAPIDFASVQGAINRSEGLCRLLPGDRPHTLLVGASNLTAASSGTWRLELQTRAVEQLSGVGFATAFSPRTGNIIFGQRRYGPGAGQPIDEVVEANVARTEDGEKITVFPSESAFDLVATYSGDGRSLAGLVCSEKKCDVVVRSPMGRKRIVNTLEAGIYTSLVWPSDDDLFVVRTDEGDPVLVRVPLDGTSPVEEVQNVSLIAVRP